MHWWARGEPHPEFLPRIGPRGVLGTPVSSPHRAGVGTVHLFNRHEAQAARGSWVKNRVPHGFQPRTLGYTPHAWLACGFRLLLEVVAVPVRQEQLVS